ncbi:hypothetical protein [Streptomyces sp. I4(2020)]|uniref:hypothetical protein n=1 Tax=Streptomyces sp. I4(2020) TaxID=2760981 RepID=UPI0018EE7FB4|nr:hypothetical protein [Streptomyces sp. I4(2020)]MBJ6613918.1 hypothetical protein [Streptomyces sp. I3(2020)]MBJ6628729.1 hypothetical protein [Streptomyces sp. I4(2020)]
MTQRFDVYRRLEPDPRARAFAGGFAATLHDPLWFLARQWQLGEHQGENASTPVRVELTAVQTTIRPEPGSPDRDPATVPAEAIVEAEPDQWWTIGRRIRVGAVVAGRAAHLLAAGPEYRLASPPPPYSGYDRRLPPPYERLAGGFDGYALWRDRVRLGLTGAHFAGLGIPTTAQADSWQSDELVYEAGFPIGDPGAGQRLNLHRHRGGRVDWFAADAESDVPSDPAGAGFTQQGTSQEITCYPTQLQYPGAPLPRWWEIEDAAVDIGGYPPDTSHFATTLLIDLIASHSDDWFVFPVPAKAGHVLTLQQPTVIDGFGCSYPLAPPTGWSLFRSRGLDSHSLLVWLRALTPAEGPAIEQVLLGLDEYSNALWAVEQRVAGHTLAAPERTPAEERANPTLAPPDRSGEPGERQWFTYVPGRGQSVYWHPYEIDDVPGADGVPRRRFVQRRMADLARTRPELLPAPSGELLRVRGDTTEVIHEIEPATVPSIGVLLERRYYLARDVLGQPVLWRSRRRAPCLYPPGTMMRFDVLAEGHPKVPTP